MEGQKLQCHVPTQFRIVCAIHDTHSTRSDGFQNFIACNPGSGQHGISQTSEGKSAANSDAGGSAGCLVVALFERSRSVVTSTGKIFGAPPLAAVVGQRRGCTSSCRT